jgi:hypothetical protein
VLLKWLLGEPVRITAADVTHQAVHLVVRVALVLLIGAVIDELFLHRTFAPAQWGLPVAYLLWKSVKRDRQAWTGAGRFSSTSYNRSAETGLAR